MGAAVCTLDLVFVIDSSYLVGQTNWNYILNFTASLASRFVVGTTATQIGFVTYGFSGINQFYLNTHGNTSSVVNAILRLPYSADWSNQISGITTAYSTSFLVTNGNRTYAPDVIVVLSAVPPNQPASSDPTVAAQIAQNLGIKVYSVGVYQANPAIVYNVSSYPRIENITYFNIATFDALYSRVDQIYNQICGPAVYEGTFSYSFRY